MDLSQALSKAVKLLYALDGPYNVVFLTRPQSCLLKPQLKMRDGGDVAVHQMSSNVCFLYSGYLLTT